MNAISQTTFSNAFSWMKFVLKGPINNTSDTLVLKHGGPKMKRKVNKDVKPRIPLTLLDLNIMRP